MSEAEPTRGQQSGGHHPAHPTPATYLKIAAILAVVTAIEVALFYIEALASLLLPMFLILSAVKFLLVAMFYMHLRFESSMFSWFFAGGLLLAAAVLLALMGLFGALL